MMNGLEMPKVFSRAGVECQEAVTEETGAGTIRAIKIIGWRSQRNVRDSALFVDRHPAPVVGAANILPGIFRPGIVAKLPGMGNGMKDPDHLSREYVIGTNIAGRRSVLFSSRRAKYQEILKNPSQAARLNDPDGLRISAQAFLQIDTAMVAKRIHQRAGARIERMKHVV